MPHYTVRDLPRLELEFDWMTGTLEKSTFIEGVDCVATHKFGKGASSELFVRELCLLILLAKYRGVNPRRPFEPIEFEEELKRSSWISALGVSFGKETHKAYFQRCFGENKFASAKRGDAHIDRGQAASIIDYPSVLFNPIELPLQHVHIYRRRGPSLARIRTRVAHKKIPELAEKLEVGRFEGEHKWVPIVEQMVKNIDADRPLDENGKSLLLTGNEPVPFKISDAKNDLLMDISKQIENRRERGTWYVLSSVPQHRGLWKKNFISSLLEYRSLVRFVHHKPMDLKSATKHDHAAYQAEARSEVKTEMSWSMKEMSKWVEELKLEKSAREMKRFEYAFTDKKIPYVAILFVPFSKSKSRMRLQKAPAGTWCAVSMHSINPEQFGDNYAMYFDKPSPMLDWYFRSISDFFHNPRQFEDPIC